MTGLPPIVLVSGRGGQGRVVLDALFAAGRQVLGILDDDLPAGAPLNGATVLGPIADWRRHLEFADFVLANGQRDRLALAGSITGAGGRLAAAISHPRATVSPFATIAEGAVIMPGVTINANASIGGLAIVNANCSIDHDCVLEAASQLGPGVTFPGNVRVGTGAFVGAGAVALPGRVIGEWAVVGAGAVVVKDVPAGATVAGNPARPLAPG